MLTNILAGTAVVASVATLGVVVYIAKTLKTKIALMEVELASAKARIETEIATIKKATASSLKNAADNFSRTLLGL